MIRRPQTPFITIILVLLCYIFYVHTHAPPSSSRPLVIPSQPPTPSTAGPKNSKSKIAILTFSTQETTYDHISLSNKHEYAHKHGYDLYVDFSLPPGSVGAVRGAVWHKLTMLEDAMARGDYEWLWWVDYDTLITNTGTRIEDVVAESLRDAEKQGRKGIEMLLTADCFPLNAGSMLMRPTPNLTKFIALVKECGAAQENKNEQDCMRDLVSANKDGVADRAFFIPQWKINAFPPEIACFDKSRRPWQFGDFVVHFPGAWAHVKGEDAYGQMMRKYAPFIDRPAEKKVTVGKEEGREEGEEKEEKKE